MCWLMLFIQLFLINFFYSLVFVYNPAKSIKLNSKIITRWNRINETSSSSSSSRNTFSLNERNEKAINFFSFQLCLLFDVIVRTRVRSHRCVSFGSARQAALTLLEIKLRTPSLARYSNAQLHKKQVKLMRQMRCLFVMPEKCLFNYFYMKSLL